VLIIFLVRNGAASHATVREALANPICAVLVAAAIIAGVVHMRVGMQVIIEDYVHHEGLKIAALLANTFVAVLVGVAGAFAILKMAFGG
jgi:succinate dehydrogenase / fumarate reductase membrane anchor subunit